MIMEEKIETLLRVHYQRLERLWRYRFDADDFDKNMMLFESELTICNQLSRILYNENIYPFWEK